MTKNIYYYPSTLANLTLIILFSEMLKFSKIISSKSKNIVKENSEYLRIFKNISFVEMKVLKLIIICLTNMCWNGQPTTTMVFPKIWEQAKIAWGNVVWSSKKVRVHTTTITTSENS
jgi:hypothetical protein